jgi:hypothetical protein
MRPIGTEHTLLNLGIFPTYRKVGNGLQNNILLVNLPNKKVTTSLPGFRLTCWLVYANLQHELSFSQVAI